MQKTFSYSVLTVFLFSLFILASCEKCEDCEREITTITEFNGDTVETVERDTIEYCDGVPDDTETVEFDGGKTIVTKTKYNCDE